MSGNDTDAAQWLLGRWRLQRADQGLELLPETLMDFRGGGELIYTITLEGREAAIEMRYRVEGNALHTEHPDGANPVISRISRDETGLLCFDFGGRCAWFRRESLM